MIDELIDCIKQIVQKLVEGLELDDLTNLVVMKFSTETGSDCFLLLLVFWGFFSAVKWLNDINGVRPPKYLSIDVCRNNTLNIILRNDLIVFWVFFMFYFVF